MKYDLIIVGSGPAGIFTALELIRKKTNKKILLIERASLLKKGTVQRTKPVIA